MDEKIRNIIFDLGGVLIDLDIERGVKILAEAGMTDVRHLLTGTNESGVFRAYECGDITTAQFRDELRIALGKPLGDEEIDRIWNSMLLGVKPEKLDLLIELRKRYHVYLLSNNNELHWKYGLQFFHYRGLEMEDFFERIFLSCRMHMAKPDPDIFRQVLKEAQLLPEETLFIDDSAANCEVASSLGIHAVHYTPGEDLKKLLACD